MHGDGNGWVVCARRHRHWGRYGAAGLLVVHDGSVVLQLRAGWSHHGGTWGLPGGARDSHENARTAALREAAEETDLDPSRLRVADLIADDHGGWTYTTVVARTDVRLAVRAAGGESEQVRWVTVEEVGRLPLHPGFAAMWPALRVRLDGFAAQGS